MSGKVSKLKKFLVASVCALLWYRVGRYIGCLCLY